MFTDHNIVTVNVCYQLGQRHNKDESALLDSARRLHMLDFSKAPWSDIRRELSKVNWALMESLASKNYTIAHSWFICQILPILEKLVPSRNCLNHGRSSLHRKRKLMWRKLARVKSKLKLATSAKNVSKLLKQQLHLKHSLKAMYSQLQLEQETKVVKEMKDNSKVVFSHARARQKTH